MTTQASHVRRGLVSVLIPTYNRGNYLPAAVESVLAQTYADLEIIIGDNCSTDGSDEVAERLARLDRRIILVRQPVNIGCTENMRSLLGTAGGEFVKFLMDDDLLAPSCVERLVAACSYAPDITLATSKRTVIDEHGTPQPDTAATQAIVGHDAVMEGAELGDLVLRRNLNLIGEPSTALFRRAAAPALSRSFSVAAEDFDLNSDVALWLNLLARGRAAYVAEPLSQFRVHSGQGQRQEATVIAASLEWPRLVRAAATVGFLRDPVHRLEAQSACVQTLVLALGSVTSDAGRAHLLAAIRQASDEVSAGADETVEARKALPPVSVIIPLTGPMDAALRCLSSVEEHTGDRDYEAVIVHDGTDPAVAELVASLDGDVTTVSNGARCGLAASCNRGAAAARGETLVFLTGQPVVAGGWLDEAVTVDRGRFLAAGGFDPTAAPDLLADLARHTEGMALSLKECPL